MTAEAAPQDEVREQPEGYSARQPASAALDKQRLQVAIETAETILQRTGKALTPAKRAHFIAALYDYLPPGEISQQTRDNIIKLFESAS